MEPQPNFSTLKPQWSFLAPPQEPGELGRLGQYRILKQLGQGGMGVVFQAEDRQLRRLAALKVMRPDCATGEEARSRFFREVRAAAALKHDNIVTVYQVGEDNGVPFIAMEFLTGKSLDEWLRPDRRASISEALVIAKQIAKGLAAAHALGVIHRDIKPANLWLEAPRGRIKILDFGLARLTASELTALTQNGAVLGTPAFMPPEQARGEMVDQRCDLFSFGCVLYRMVTARLPFQGNTLYAVLTAVASETPPVIRELNPDVPAQLEVLIERMLAKKPVDRPATAQEVLDELQEIEKTLRIPERPPQPPDEPENKSRSSARRPWLAALGGLAALAIGISTVAIVTRPQGKPETTAAGPASVANANSVNLLSLVDVKRDRLLGDWTMQGEGGLRGQAAASDEVKSFDLVLPWEPPPEYRLKLTVTRLRDEVGNFIVGLASGAARFGIVFDAPHNGKLATGVTNMDGRGVLDQTEIRHGRVLPAKLPISLIFTVQTGKLAVEANGREIYQWQGDLSRLTRPSWQSQHPLLLHGANKGAFAIDEIVLTPLGPDAGKLVDRPAGEGADAAAAISKAVKKKKGKKK